MIEEAKNLSVTAPGNGINFEEVCRENFLNNAEIGH